MLSQRSIRAEYTKQLIFASLSLIAIFSLILYGYIKSSIYDDIREGLIEEAKFISISNTNIKELQSHSLGALRSNEFTLSLINDKNLKGEIYFETSEQKGQHLLTLFYPYELENQSYLKITKDVSDTESLLAKILNSILIINFGALVLVQIYAFVLSKMLSRPIKMLSNTLCKMNEDVLQPVQTHNMPTEFVALGDSLNSLIERIQKYVEYQKELFIGIAHELKTPLAVMKLKNEVLLIKKRECDKYVDGIKLNIESINEMNQMISTLLEVGRQEGAQFETPKEIDIISFAKDIADDFTLLAESENKSLKTDFSPKSFPLLIQPTLLLQIIQNFLQNALKFTPEGKSVEIKSYLSNTDFYLEVIDEGPGIEGSIDIYAPFKRSGNKSGAGLGLFLAKSAANSLGVQISITNRIDAKGAVASIQLDTRKYQIKPPPKTSKIRRHQTHTEAY